MGPRGIVSYVTKAALADFRNGIQLLNMITPRSADLHVTHAAAPVTIEELDAELERQGLPRTAEIFPLSFRSEDDSDVTEAEIVAEEAAKK